MSTQASDTSVRHSIVVEAPIEQAFSVFTDGFGNVQAAGAQPARTHRSRDRLRAARAGGHLHRGGVDGSECRWARVLVYEPPNRPRSAGTSARSGRSRPTHDKTSEVDVRFVAEGPSAPRRAGAPQPGPSRRGLGVRSATASAATAAGRSTSTGSRSRLPDKRHR